MKTIFLDFDGVLNNADFFWRLKEHQKANQLFMTRGSEELDPEKVKLISDFALEMDATIVVSSSWRILHSLSELQDFLKDVGMDERVLPISVTPQHEKGFRGTEVRSWLEQNPHVTNYVIFDDDGDFYPSQRLVQTSWDTGLLPIHIDAAGKILQEDSYVG